MALLLATPFIVITFGLVVGYVRTRRSPQERDQAFQDREKRLGGDHGL